MELHRPAITEEMKAFLQEGLSAYAPALVALSEFRRQVRSRLQTVIDDFSAQFSEVGLSVADCRPNDKALDATDLDRDPPFIGLKKNHGGGVSSGCLVRWELGQPKDKQAWVGVWVYLGKKPERERLFAAMQERRPPEATTRFEYDSDGSALLWAYVDPDLFYKFEEQFCDLIEEWVGLLSSVGGIKPFMSDATAQTLERAAD